MRRAAIVVVRSMIVLLLAAAALDLPLPRSSGDRLRVHLVDRSDSVRIPGPRESLTLKDVDDIIAHDRDAKASGDTVTWASFGKNLVAWESADVPSGGSALSLALQSALGRNPTEIILYTDGRADPKDALFLCRQRGVPVHILPVGPTSVRDVRFRRISAPASVRKGEAYAIDVVVESTFAVECKISIGADARSTPLAPGVPALLSFPRTATGPFEATIDAADDCPANNVAKGEVFLESDLPKVLAVSSGLAIPGVDLTVAAALPPLGEYDAVILDNLELPPADQRRLADYVRDGGGLVLLGGPKSHALGGWKHTPIEKLSPLKVHPDLRVSVVLGIDVSGSMTSDFDRAAQALRDAAARFDTDDDVVAMTFADNAEIVPIDALRKVRPTGGTRIARAITEAARHLTPRATGRKVIVLMTDGESATEETPEMIRAAVAGLQNIGLIVITTKKKVSGVETNIEIADWTRLGQALASVTDGIQELQRQAPGILELRAHPITAGVQPVVIPWINRATAKPDAQVLATVGKAPQQDPVLALQGRVVAFTIPYTPALELLFRQALNHAIGDRASGLKLTIDAPLVIAEGVFKDPEFDTDGVPVRMSQVGARRWEGRLPDDLSGSVIVRKGRTRAAATIPCPPELAALGVDRAALERIAEETGGRVLQSTAELDALPRPRQSAPRGGRTIFLIAALALVFVELSVSIYWKV